jgi:murein DD-endopeptidase MepM/ murein hydrolase activator NlpD
VPSRLIPVCKAVLVVAAAVLLAASSLLAPARAVAKTTWQLNEELGQTRERLAQAKQKAAQAQADKLAADRDIAGLDQKIELLDERAAEADRASKAAAAKLAGTRKTLVKLNTELAKTRVRLDQAEADLDRATTIFETRTVGIYKGGRVEYMLVLLQQGDLSDLLTRMDLLSKVMDQDLRMAEEIRVLRARVLDDGRAIEAKRAEASAVEQQQQLEADALDKVVAVRAATLKEATDARAAKLKLAAKAETDKETWQEKARQLENESAQIQTMLRGSGSGGSVRGTGQMIWPVEGEITSPFGERESPIFHTMEMHTGMDIAADSGTPIYAADSGTVVLADWKGGYGKCVIISHGNGLSTLYGHQSKLLVSEGQTVLRGQLIGRVGSTGWATGPHLHFEVRSNGDPVDPAKYL